MAPEGSFRNEIGVVAPCTIIRRGGNNTRVQLRDGTRKLVPTSSVAFDAEAPRLTDSSRIIPTTPLERLYRSFRQLKGSRMARFRQIERSLEPRNGPTRADFLSELFTRSVDHASSYRNLEPFYDNDTGARATASEGLTFAPDLVRRLDQSKDAIPIGSFTVRYVDHELFPFRTTLSCNELGKPATRLGSGGMDLLLASELGGRVLPAIGEIKAASEHVGTTFALVQSLMYASQLATAAQLDRIQKHYTLFGDIRAKPRYDIFILLEGGPPKNSVDQDYAINLAKELMETKVSDHIRSITIVTCGNTDLKFREVCSFIATR